MKCEQWKERIWEYLENELSEDEMIAVEQHLEECRDCTAFMEETKEVLFGLQNLPQVELPQDFHSRLMDKLAQETNVVPFPVKKNTQNRWKRLSLVAAAALVVVAVGSRQGAFDFRDKQEDLIQMTVEQGTGNQLKPDTEIPEESQGRTPETVPETQANTGGEQPAKVEIQQSKVEELQGEPKKADLQKVESKKTEVNLTEAKNQTKGMDTPQKEQAQPAQGKLYMATPQSVQAEEPTNQPMAMNATAEDAPVVGKGMLRSAPMPTITPDDTVILTVPTEEGVFGEIRDLAVTYAGYEMESEKSDVITLSIPREQVKGFYEALEELGKVRLMEESHPEKEAEIIEISLEVKA